MKKLIVMAVAILLTGCITAFASGTNKKVSMPGKQFDYHMSFSKIVLDDDIELELKESETRIIDVSGKPADVGNVDWKIKGDVLYIRSKKGSLKNKVRVAVNVNQLKQLVVRGESHVNSDGALLSPALYVYIENDCHIAIKNTGLIHVVKTTGTEIRVEKSVGDVRVAR